MRVFEGKVPVQIIGLTDTASIMQRQVGQDDQSERLYRRWVGDLLRAASDDLTPEAWGRLMRDIERIRVSA
jgi:hypothetical protein